MKSLPMYFAGLVVLFLLASCNLNNTGQVVSLPTATITVTPTLTIAPSITPLSKPTRRATLITFLTVTRGPSVTPMPLVTPIPSDVVLTIQAKITEVPRGSGPPAAFACRFLSSYPEAGAIFRPKEGFTAIWRVKNVGLSDWTIDNVAFYHVSGTNFEYKTYKTDFIPYVVNVKDQLNLHVPMHAPVEEGVYSAVWALRSKSKKLFFCSLQIIIVVEARNK